MTEQSFQTFQVDEINLLDILVALAESWRLIIFGPLIAGVLTVGLSFLSPKTYEANAILRLDENDAYLLHTAPVLDPLIQQFGLLVKYDGNLENARQELKKHIVFAIDKKSKLTVVAVKAETPEVAKRMGELAIANLIQMLQIKGSEKLYIENLISIKQESLNVYIEAINTLEKKLKTPQITDQFAESFTKNISILNAEKNKLSTEIIEYKRKLSKSESDVYIQQFYLPTSAQSSKFSGLVAMFVMFASGFSMILFVLVRKAWVSADKNPESALKVAAIRRSLGLGEK